MSHWLDSILILLALTNLVLVGSSLLGGCIRMVALQGILLGFLPLMGPSGEWTIRSWALAFGSIILKGVIFPSLLSRALREAEVRREVQPMVGYVASLMVALIGLGVSFYVGTRLPLPKELSLRLESDWVVPMAFFTTLTGLFIMVSRRQALNQVLGYLVLENGIYAFGVLAVPNEPLLVELGILLDVFVAVFIMGLTLFYMNREFDHLSADRLSNLKDSVS